MARTKELADRLGVSASRKGKGKPKAKGGRPTKCTRAFLDDFEVLLLGGSHPKSAFLALGASTDSFDRWRERGEKEPDTLYGEFCLILSRSHSMAKVSVDNRTYRSATAGDVSAARLWYMRQRAEGFEPQNAQGPSDIPFDDDDVLRSELTSRLDRLAQSKRAG